MVSIFHLVSWTRSTRDRDDQMGSIILNLTGKGSGGGGGAWAAVAADGLPSLPSSLKPR